MWLKWETCFGSNVCFLKAKMLLIWLKKILLPRYNICNLRPGRVLASLSCSLIPGSLFHRAKVQTKTEPVRRLVRLQHLLLQPYDVSRAAKLRNSRVCRNSSERYFRVNSEAFRLCLHAGYHIVPTRNLPRLGVKRNAPELEHTSGLFLVGFKSHSKLLTSVSDRFSVDTLPRGVVRPETYPIHFQDRRGAASLRHENRAIINVLGGNKDPLFRCGFHASTRDIHWCRHTGKNTEFWAETIPPLSAPLLAGEKTTPAWEKEISLARTEGFPVRQLNHSFPKFDHEFPPKLAIFFVTRWHGKPFGSWFTSW